MPSFLPVSRACDIAVCGVLLASSFAARNCDAQDQVRTWGLRHAVDTDVFRVPVRTLSSSSARDLTIVAAWDGRLLALGENAGDVALPPPPTSGSAYVRVSASGMPVAELSNGLLVQWSNFVTCSTPTAPPTLPLGMSWTGIASGDTRSFALRSDGVILSWGCTGVGLELVPTLSTGLTYQSVATGSYFAGALVSDGSLRVWGQNVFAVQSIPPTPPGVAYSQLKAGQGFLLALRTDGEVVAWGDNTYGQCAVPALPSGRQYVRVAAGGAHALALRSDGTWVAWGRNDRGQCNIPPAPQSGYADMVGGFLHTAAVDGNGMVTVWGSVTTPAPLASGTRYRSLDMIVPQGASVLLSDGSLTGVLTVAPGFSVPTLPSGVQYSGCSSGYNFWLGLGTDGLLRAWGSNLHGQLSVPALPPGLTYVEFDAGEQSAVAIRSDGTAVAWGDNSWGQTVVPPLPSGLHYSSASVGKQNVLYLRSDGSLALGGFGTGLGSPPPLPPGLSYTKSACGELVAGAIRSDGTIASWGSGGNAPALPNGLSYIEMAAADRHLIARRSDGAVVTWGYGYWVTRVPDLPQGRSFLRIAAEYESSGGLVGSASRYVPIGSGCSGSRPAARIVPGDTPQLGRSLPVRILNLPTGSAMLAFGWSRLNPSLSMGSLGMPGCFVHTSLDAMVLVQGVGSEALFSIPIPYMPGLIGMQFYNQALVIDPNAPNPSGAVLSEAMEATIGG